MTAQPQALVAALEIDGLFGTKFLSLRFDGDGPFSGNGRRLTLLYGSNGSGKTSVLKLLWNALSPSDSDGHRTYISHTPFKTFTIYLCSGDVICFTKTADELVGDFSVSVTNGTERLVEQVYHDAPRGLIHSNREIETLFSENELNLDSRIPMEDRVRIRVERDIMSRRQSYRHKHGLETDRFVQYLRQVNAGPYMLADDRRIYGDDIELKHRTPTMHLDEADQQVQPHGVSAELTTAMRRVNELVQTMILKGNVSGSQGSNTVYLGILEKVSQPDLSKIDSTTRSSLIARLDDIANKTAEYSTYGLMPKIDRDSFIRLIRRTPDNKIGVADAVMQPFLEAQRARLDGLNSAASLLKTLTMVVNQFLTGGGKRVTYSLHRGLRVLSEDGATLSPDSLSSGERQILLLLLNTVLARDNTKLFLIDEPELSLNVKWQRQLMDALLSLTEGSSVQFIVATHSIEVITGHNENLAQVVSRNRSRRR